MPRRLGPPRDPVEIEHDGERIVAERGEPIALALIAAGRMPLARSPKLHRPRGPYCLRGACDGCLARVNGVPNVMTCFSPATGGERIETQNVLGTRGVDMLRATDFLFPRGMDHHRLFAGIRGVSSVVQSFARRVAGLGRIPDEPLEAQPAEERELDVLIVGGGRNGLAAARALGGTNSLLVDDGLELGGALFALDPEAAERAASNLAIETRSRTSAVLVSREPTRKDERLWALCAGPEGATLCACRSVLVASGAHDAVHAFENNDLPGVFSARAALTALRRGVLVGERIALVGGGRFQSAFAEAVGQNAHVFEVPLSKLERVVGRSGVTAVLVDGKKERADAVLVDGPGRPAIELAVQGGGIPSYDPELGYRLSPDADGCLGPGLFFASGASDSDGAHVGSAVIRTLNLR
jgi:sarcosine oxidase subunit alpha